jgi:hypothetical protein
VIFRNDQELGNHWLRVKLQGTTCNRDAIGAVIELNAGQRVLSRMMMPTKSYLSQCEQVVTFGLGQAAQVDELTVSWPGGDKERFSIEAVDRTITLIQGNGQANVAP